MCLLFPFVTTNVVIAREKKVEMAINGLGLRLAAVRRGENLSQEEMSQRLGISRSAYQNYERNQRDFTAQLLLKVLEEFAVDPLWMLVGDSDDGRDPRSEKLAKDYRVVGISVERRIADRGLQISPEKKWDAIEFLLDEIPNTDDLDSDVEGIDTTRIDRILRLVS